jgi:hypothetical protein
MNPALNAAGLPQREGNWTSKGLKSLGDEQATAGIV